MTKVKLKNKAISSYHKSLYLDFYTPIKHAENEKDTCRYFFELYLFEKAKTSLDKHQNKEHFTHDENIQQQRQIEIQN